MNELIPVRVGECLCPDTPHADGDVVSLRPKLGLAAGIAIQRLVIEANQNRDDRAEITGLLAESYLLQGVAAWTFQDEAGLPIPVTDETIREKLLSDFSLAAPIADVADDLYMATVILPLVVRAQTLSQSTPTNGSTSLPRSGTSKRPKRSKPSSTSPSLTDSTERTSSAPAGVSN